MSIVDEVMALVPWVPRPPEDPVPRGTTEEVIDALGVRVGMRIPDELRAWLLRCNCGMIGPGGMYGACPDSPNLDIEGKYPSVSPWRRNGWIPVAGDGCGDYYVLDTTRTTRNGHPVLFLDHEESVETYCDKVGYVVASGLWPFLRYIFLGELLNKQEALREDPGLADVVGVPRPWHE